MALTRPPVTIGLELRRLNGEILQCELPFPDEVSALVLKSLATTIRSKDADTADVWRCLEIAFAAGLMTRTIALAALAALDYLVSRSTNGSTPEALRLINLLPCVASMRALCRRCERALVLMDRDGFKSARDARLAPCTNLMGAGLRARQHIRELL